MECNLPFVIASVSEATQLTYFKRALYYHCDLRPTISWVASRSFAMTGN